MEELRQVTKRIDASDVVSLLREVYPNGVRGRKEVEALIALDREFPDPQPEWLAFMAEALADHLLRRSEPVGVITAAKSQWLIHAIAPSGRIATLSGAQALIRTIELAAEVHVSLAAFAIRERWRDVIAGGAPAVSGRVHCSRVLDARDVALLRRILEASAGKSGAPVSAEEAEALFDLHDAVAGRNNHASFDDLFFRAIVNYLLGASDCKTPPRKAALAREPHRQAGRGMAAECLAWLSSRIMRDGRPTPAERALLGMLDRAEPDPSLARSYGRAA